MQLFRIFNGILSKRKESRRRNLQFHLPCMIPITPSVRMVQDDSSYINMQSIFEDYCRRNGVNKDEPVLFSIEKLRALAPVRDVLTPRFYLVLLTPISRKILSMPTAFASKHSPLFKINMSRQPSSSITSAQPTLPSLTSGSSAALSHIS